MDDLREGGNDVSQIPERIDCPNCEDSVGIPQDPGIGREFPCPKCSFMIRKGIRRDSRSGLLAVLSKILGAGDATSLFLVLAGAAFIFGLFFFASFAREAFRKPSPDYSRPAGLDSARFSESSEVITNSVGMKLKLVPAGSFLMGSSAGGEDERPVHKVTISKPFYMGVHEVTAGQWKEVMEEPTFFPLPDNKPVLFVSWNKAKEFCRKLSEIDGGQYRLPTEAEWEYACRAGTQTEFHWGNSYQAGFEWSHVSSWYHFKDGRPSTRSTHPVGSLKPNPWGFHDMAGNISEWCEDFYGSPYPSEDQIDPTGPPNGKSRVVRGGDYSTLAVGLRSARRSASDPGTDPMSPGFRVVKLP